MIGNVEQSEARRRAGITVGRATAPSSPEAKTEARDSRELRSEVSYNPNGPGVGQLSGWRRFIRDQFGI